MTHGNIRIRKLPVFPKGTFHSHPELFGRFNQNSPEHLQSRYEQIWRAIPRHEETITWPLLAAPGVWAATHPGADTVFVEIMVGITGYVYNSDCLYANTARRVFAISDPPGITTGSRRLFERLERYLAVPGQDLAQMIERLNQETRPEEGATLALVSLPVDRPDTAQLVVAGDSLLFHGNSRRHTLRGISGRHEFIGTPYASFTVQEMKLEAGDFFVIASDGILSLANHDPTRNLPAALLAHLDSDAGQFVERAMVACNACYTETIYDRAFSRFGGSDNVSLLLVSPQALAADTTAETTILGGYIEPRD